MGKMDTMDGQHDLNTATITNSIRTIPINKNKHRARDGQEPREDNYM